MSIATFNGHSRVGARSADTVDTRLAQTDAVDVGTHDAAAAVFNVLVVSIATTFGSALTLANSVVSPAVTFSGPAVFNDSLVIAAGHTTSIQSATTLAAGGSVASGQTLGLAGVTVSGTPTLSGGATVSSGQTLVLSGANVSGTPTLTGGAVVSSGQTLALSGTAAVSGNAAFVDGATLASSKTLTFTGATLNGGGTGVLTGLFTLNTIRMATVLSRRYAAPVAIAPGRVFPTLRPPANPLGVFVIDATSFSGEASNGSNSGGVRGSNFTSTPARPTAVDNTDCGLQDFVVYNRSPYTFYLPNGTFQNMTETSMITLVWYPLTSMRCSRTSFPSPGPSTTWKATTDALKYVSGWASLSTALLTSADCTFDLYRHQYSVLVSGGGSAGRVTVELRGQLVIYFTKGAADPVRIQVPLPVGAIAETAYPAVSGFTPRCGVFRDWVVSGGNTFADNTPMFAGSGELVRALGTYARSDATAVVAAYIENTDPNAGYVRVVASGFTGGAGSYKLRCTYRTALENLVYRPTYDTFSYVV